MRFTSPIQYCCGSDISLWLLDRQHVGSAKRCQAMRFENGVPRGKVFAGSHNTCF